MAVTKKTVGDGEKLLTYLNSALKVLLLLDIFPRVPKKVKFCCPVLGGLGAGLDVLDMSLAPIGIRPRGHPDCSLVTTLTTP